jgi:hypothetical protein
MLSHQGTVFNGFLWQANKILLRRENRWKQFQSSGYFTCRYHRLHAAWSFNFHLTPRTFALLDTTGFMPRGDSAAAYVVRKRRGETDRDWAEIEAPRGIKPVVS